MAKWIWTKEDYNHNQAVAVCFRKTFSNNGSYINITADTKYKLFINGNFITLGPRKGDAQIWYYEHIDIQKYLLEGENVIAIEVLRYPPIPYKGNRSCWRLKDPFLYIESDNPEIETNEGYKCVINKHHQIQNKTGAYIRLFNEEIYFSTDEFYRWNQLGFDDSAWENAIVCDKFIPSLSPVFRKEREIPLLSLQQRNFTNVIQLSQSSLTKQNYQDLIENNKPVTIAANSIEIVEIEAEKLTTGYLRITTSKGKDTHITILQSESYNQDIIIDGKTVSARLDRKDHIHGQLLGPYDEVYVLGKEQEVYEPFDFKTFRFIKLTIETKDEPITINSFDYVETHYPLEIQNTIDCDNQSYMDIYKASIDTLLACMHETYEDCPAYEQLQYLWDTRSEALFTYYLSTDDALALNALDDFARSQRYDGLLSACYPTYKSNVIPSFSFYFIQMLYDHMMHFGKKEVIRKYYPVCVKILDFFTNHLNDKNLIRPIENAGETSACYWNYIDLTESWPNGIVNVDNNKEITMYSLHYVYACQKMSEMMNYLGFTDLANYYDDLQKATSNSIREYCYKDGLIYDSPYENIYSVQGQTYGILTGILDKEEGKNALSHALDTVERCSLSFIPYLLDALNQVDLQKRMDESFQRYRTMLDNNCSTLVEHDSLGSYRSDCHGWSSSMIYAFYAIILGVKPTKPGFEEISFQPHLLKMSYAKGTIATIKGNITICVEKKDGELRKKITLPETIKIA